MSELGWFYKTAPWEMESLAVLDLLEWVEVARKTAKILNSKTSDRL